MMDKTSVGSARTIICGAERVDFRLYTATEVPTVMKATWVRVSPGSAPSTDLMAEHAVASSPLCTAW